MIEYFSFSFFLQLSKKFKKEAIELKQKIDEKLWDSKDQFYKVLTYVTPVKKVGGEKNKFVSVRELHGYTPWYVDLIKLDIHLFF